MSEEVAAMSGEFEVRCQVRCTSFIAVDDYEMYN